MFMFLKQNRTSLDNPTAVQSIVQNIPFCESMKYLKFIIKICYIAEYRSAADIAFLIGATKGSPEWPYFINFAKQVVDSFDVSPNGVHIGAMTFGNQPKLGFRFNTWTGPRYTGANVKGSLSRLLQGDGNLQIGRALAAVKKDLFSKEGGTRCFVPKVKFITSLVVCFDSI